MNALLTTFASLPKPDIFGDAPITFREIVENPWFWPLTGLLIVVLVCLVVLAFVRLRERARERARMAPYKALRGRYESLRTRAEKPDEKFFRDLGAIMRTALGMRFQTNVGSCTARELETRLKDRDSQGLSAPALDVIRACENAMFSGAGSADAHTLLNDAQRACAALTPDTFADDFGKGGAQ